MGRQERKSLRLDAAARSTEGRLFEYLNTEPTIGTRELALKALRSFYLPWVLEKELNEEQLKRLARTAIEELQFRMFQIQQRFLLGESVATFAIEMPAATALASRIVEPAIPGSEGFADAITLAQMQQEVANLAELSKVLDDF
jgi:hypothetical protein